MPRFTKLVIAAMVLTVTAGPACAQKPVEAPEATPRTPDEQRVIEDFKQRVAKYDGVSAGLKKQVYPASSELDPATIHARQKELAARLIKALPGWKQGDLFTPGIAALFKRRIAEVVNGPEGQSVKAAIFDDAPGAMAVDVFAEYPSGLPIATLPAQMLKLFPVLPKELEYRFLGHHLIIMDIAAFLILDVIPNAIK